MVDFVEIKTADFVKIIGAMTRCLPNFLASFARNLKHPIGSCTIVHIADSNKTIGLYLAGLVYSDELKNVKNHEPISWIQLATTSY